jgi:serine/threonine protein kinase
MINLQVFKSSSDIWSLGCIIFTLMELKHPFSYNEVNSIIFYSNNTSIQPFKNFNYSIDLINIIQQMISFNPFLLIDIQKLENILFLQNIH